MIKNANNETEQFLQIVCDGSFLGKKIFAEYQTENAHNQAMFYVLNQCAFMVMGDNLSLCGFATDEDIEQILTFANFIGVKTLESQLLDIPVGVLTKLQLLEYRGEHNLPFIQVIENENIYGFTKFCCDNFSGIQFDTVYSYLARKVNHGVSTIYYLAQNTKPVCGAVVSCYDENTVYITFVSTAKPLRGQGYAKKILQHITGIYAGKKIYLVCENELENFYKNIGFYPMDTITLNQLREEKI